MPRGVALVIGCNTFPTWNSWPGLFASLVTGNPVVVKPHPAAVLPLAITVQACQEVLAEAGFDRNLVTLAVEDPADRLAATLAVRPEVRLIDFTGGNAFGEWLEDNARQAIVFTEKAGVNTVVIDSTDDFKAMCQNLAFSFSLYTGQMCTAPQNVYLPVGRDRDRRRPQVRGRGRRGDRRRARQAARRRRAGGRAARRGRERRCARAARGGRLGERGEVLVPSRAVTHPAYADATVRTPTIDRPDRRGLRRLRVGVLRPGRLPHLHRRAPTSRSTCSATP